MPMRLTPRELAYSGLFGAAALLLPTLFHALRLGHVFMPMYLPLVALAFFVRPLPAAITALMTPLLSGAVTGMPPFYPPIAVLMALELGGMAGAIALVRARRPNANGWVVLLPVLLAGRVAYAAMSYAAARLVDLPAGFVAGISLLSGWPGILLMLAVVPAVARAGRGLRVERTG
jgi:hypothetical protein